MHQAPKVQKRVDDEMTDTQLLEAITAGDQSAMTTLFDRYGALAFHTALAVLEDPVQAEDAVHQVFLTIWRQPAGFSSRNGSLASWLVISVRNRALDLKRRATRLELLENLLVAEPRNMGRTLEEPELIERLKHTAKSLSPELEAALPAAFFKGLSMTEVANRSQLSPESLKSGLCSAVNAFRKVLES